MPLRLRIDGPTFRDNHNREVTLHGINLGGDAKNPSHPDQPSHIAKDFFEGDKVSFVGRPFDVSEAATHFSRLKSWGYNTLRYVYTWEALEAAGPGRYDEEFIQNSIEVLRVAKRYGFYAFMDPHQDVWSRFTGGSGAPMWTLYACGLNPKAFGVTEAALVQNTWPVPDEFPKMVWATNYNRLACQVVFTMFFAGKLFTPKAIIDGVNIQDYLQDHFVNANKHFARRIKEAGDLENDVVIGWESVNEPNRGLIGQQDLDVVPSEQKLRLYTSPTPWQAMLLGSGRACEVETWAIGGMGPYKSGSTLVDPLGQTAWLPSNYDDSRYGWRRDQQWKLGECIWAQHGVWDPSSDTLLRPTYFSKDHVTGQIIDYEYFTNHFWMPYYRKHSTAIREIFPDTFMFCQPTPYELPPSIKDTEDDDPNMVYAPHWYDGVTLMNKKWNKLWNVDVLGVLRGRYLHPAFAIKIGETAIKNCFKDQLAAIKKEGIDYMGLHPCVIGEIGIPYDMNDRVAYETGDFSNQILAMDANHYGLEGGLQHFTLWNYSATNNHQHGDNWDGEDLSVYSNDDRTLPSDSFSRAESNSSLASSKPPSRSDSTMSVRKALSDNKKRSYRAAEAYVRPYPIATHGHASSYGFDLRKCEFELTVMSPSETKQDAPTEIFLPEYHFPRRYTKVETSGGNWEICTDDSGDTSFQVLKWRHGEGEQTMKVKGLTKRKSESLKKVQDEGYLCESESKCVTM